MFNYLHWLPLSTRIQLKVLTLIYWPYIGQTPKYLRACLPLPLLFICYAHLTDIISLSCEQILLFLKHKPLPPLVLHSGTNSPLAKTLKVQSIPIATAHPKGRVCSTTPHEFVLTGDFNIQVNNPTDSFPSQFLSSLSAFNFIQHETTQESGHTHDLVITSVSSDLVITSVSSSPANSIHPIFTKLSIKSSPSFAHSVVSAPSTSSLSNSTLKHHPFSPIPQQTAMISCLHAIPLCHNSSINMLQSLLSSRLTQKSMVQFFSSSSQIITLLSRTSIQTIRRLRNSQEAQNLDKQMPQPTSFSQKTLPVISCSLKFIQPSKSLENCKHPSSPYLL